MAIKQLSDGNPDGTVLGQNASDLVGFYGATPAAQGSAITALVTTPTATDVAIAVNSIITRLQTLGINA